MTVDLSRVAPELGRITCETCPTRSSERTAQNSPRQGIPDIGVVKHCCVSVPKKSPKNKGGKGVQGTGAVMYCCVIGSKKSSGTSWGGMPSSSIGDVADPSAAPEDEGANRASVAASREAVCAW
jgi:hypothetical protein